ncbi:lytic polysaccharide monooxygenase [Stipitochalara longipes BDJ]|nr:lytic polysaccharide monooxygenase [Stipitochalara longipes BDJ]
MKFLTPLLTLATAAQAHYNFPSMNAGAAWSNVRQWTGYYTFDPVTNVASEDIRCNVNASFAASTLSVAAGSVLKWTANPDIYHPGPLLAYMAKIYQDHPTVGTSGLVWPSASATSVSFTIPAAVPAGDYLFRIEHIGLHAASGVNGAQFYISCGQLTVTGGGAGTPSPLVAFPGAYKATDPGIMLDIYYPVPTNYQPPGPAVWTG